MNRSLPNNYKNQQGIATVLIVLLVGVSMTALAMGLVRSVKSTQQTQTAVHAVTHSQSAAWAGVNIFKDYLNQLTFDDVKNLSTNNPMSISVNSMAQALSVAIINVDATQANTLGILVTANVTATDAAADSSSTIQVVYQVHNATCNLCQLLEAAINLYDDTTLGGDITILAPAGETSTVNIKGDVSARNIAFNGVTRLNSTGDVTLGSAIPLVEVYTNGNLYLEGSANVEKASALGTITTSGSGHADLMYANQDISLGGGAVAIANSRSDIAITNWANHGELHAGGNVLATSPVQKIRAKGNVEQRAWADAQDIIAEGNVTCPGNSWSVFTRIRAGGSTVNCTTSGDIQSGSNETVAVMDELVPFEQTQPRIDAWAVKASANYIFEYEFSKIKITVKNVNGVPDGIYYLGDYPDDGSTGYRDYLCTAVDNRGNCTAPATPFKTICNSFSTSNNCISYKIPSKTWEVNGRNLPPGVAWFDGNLDLANGRYYNTFVATGDLASSNDHQTMAPNYAGFEAVCENAYPQYPSTRFEGMYPTQLCDIDNGELKYEALGNIAYLAGGFDPSTGGVYKGGNINLRASNSVYGTVLAGNNLKTFGDIRIFGYISAAAHQALTTDNELGGRTYVDMSNLPDSYRPQEIPSFDGNACGSTCNPPSGPTILWTRYL